MSSFMRFALRGAVWGFILVFVLKIGTVPTEAVSASQQQSLVNRNLLCSAQTLTTCSIGSVDFPDAIQHELSMSVENSSPRKLAVPVQNLNPEITVVPQKTSICTENFVPEEEKLVIEPVLSSSVLYASPAAPLNPEITANAVTPAVTDNAGGLNAEKLFGMVNQKRAEAGLAPLQKNDAVCQVSQARAPELQSDVASGYMHRGFYARKPSFESTENMIYMRSEEEALNWWLNSPVHRGAIYGNYHDSCIVCQGDTCSQIFANVAPVPVVEPTVQPTQPAPTQPVAPAPVTAMPTTQALN